METSRIVVGGGPGDPEEELELPEAVALLIAAENRAVQICTSFRRSPHFGELGDAFERLGEEHKRQSARLTQWFEQTLGRLKRVPVSARRVDSVVKLTVQPDEGREPPAQALDDLLAGLGRLVDLMRSVKEESADERLSDLLESRIQTVEADLATLRRGRERYGA